MKQLTVIKTVLEVVLLLVFLFLLLHVARKHGGQRVLSLLTNMP